METVAPPIFDAAFRARLGDLFAWRRDVRRFRPDAVDPALMERLLDQAALSPSVGNAQPARWLSVESAGARGAVRRNFEAANAEALAAQDGGRAALYARLKLAGLDVAPVQLAVFCDRATAQGHGLGRRTMPEMLDYSVVAAVVAFWLAARAEGLGVGWCRSSILRLPRATSTRRRDGPSSPISAWAGRWRSTTTPSSRARAGRRARRRAGPWGGGDGGPWPSPSAMCETGLARRPRRHKHAIRNGSLTCRRHWERHDGPVAECP